MEMTEPAQAEVEQIVSVTAQVDFYAPVASLLGPVSPTPESLEPPEV
jgi:hypothetical protein